MPDVDRLALISDVHGNLTSVSYVRVPYDVDAELTAARELGVPQYDGYELELRHGLHRGVLDQWRAGLPISGYHEVAARR